MNARNSGRSCDLAVIGGGIVGLWTAFHAARQGLSVVLLEKRAIGSGASGGMLGALMPHHAVDWNAKKQFQLDGLMSIETEVAALEEATGMATGYRRCGRIMPIRSGAKLRQAGQWAEFARVNWPAEYTWKVMGRTIDANWLPQSEMSFGANFDTLSARISPRGLIAALRAALASMAVDVRENTEVAAIARNGVLQLAGDAVLRAGHTVLCAGWESFPLMETLVAGETGRGVKGQAALLRPARPIDPTLPILYDNGAYVIAHEDGLVALGSTSENEFSDPASTDEQLDAMIANARAICPALEGAEIVEKWAGVRPRASGREPLVGPLPGLPDTLVATGGFKISFAIAHLMAKAVLAQIAGERPDYLPKVFLPENRLGDPNA